jgi:hypothetical protein
MRQFSIRTFMAVIVVSAVGLAALGNANELWAEVMLVAGSSPMLSDACVGC